MKKRIDFVNKVRADIFKEIESITDSRHKTYGEAFDSFRRIGIMWEAYYKAKYGIDITCEASDTAFLLTLFKMSREWNNFHMDNGVDGANYFAFAVAFHGWEQSAKNAPPVYDDEEGEDIW